MFLSYPVTGLVKACFAIWNSSSQAPSPFRHPPNPPGISYSAPLAQEENRDTASSLPSDLPRHSSLRASRGYLESFKMHQILPLLMQPVCLWILQLRVSEDGTGDSLAARHVLGVVFVMSSDGSSVYSP